MIVIYLNEADDPLRNKERISSIFWWWKNEFSQVNFH